MNNFQKAQRRQVKLKIAITGPSGSGKTYSALLIAAGIGKKIAVVDSENGSASLYAGMSKGPLQGIDFDVLDLNPPYTIQKYLDAISVAEKAEYDVLIIDGISPAWAGEGGLLSKKEALDQRGGNSYTNWAGITKEHEIFKARLLSADVHVICTLRSKQDYVLEQNEKGKSAPKKVGMAPIQRDGMEYEFTTVFDLAMDHNAIASKDRTGLFDGQIFKPSQITGKKIMEWLKGGKPIEKPAPPASVPAPAPAQEPELKAHGQQPSGESKAEQPGEFPHEAPSGGDVILASMDQVAKISAGAEKLRSMGIKDATVWKGMVEFVTKTSSRGFAEPSELTNVEAEAVVDYLARWVEHIEVGKAKARARHAAEAQKEAEAYRV